MTGLNASAAADILMSVKHSAEPSLSDDELAHLDKVEEFLREEADS